MWVELIISLPEDLKEPVTAVLYEKGCIGLEDEPGALKAYFPKDADMANIKDALSRFDGMKTEESALDEQDWYAPWKETIRPIHTAGLVICPPWRECVPDSGEIPLILDPAQAFGAGDHVTTRTVLEILNRWVRKQGDLSDKKFLDLGTGTGILAIAALIYGFGEVTAVDIERSAVEAVKKNLELNGMSGRARVILGGIKDAGHGFDLVAANLFQEALLEIIPDAPAALNPEGVLIISGLLTGQEGLVFEAASARGLDVVESVECSGWVSARLLLR